MCYIESITELPSKTCKEALHDLYEIGFVEIFKENQYGLHDIVFYYIRSHPKINKYLRYKKLKIKNYEFCYKFLEKHGGEDNWNGFISLQEHWNYIWTTVQEAYKENLNLYIIKYWRYLENFLFWLGYYLTRLQISNWAKEAAETEKDIIYPWILFSVGETEWYLYGDNKRPLRFFDEASIIFKKNDNKRGEGFSLYYRGRILRQLNNTEEAKNCLEKSLTIAEAIQDDQLTGLCLNNLGNLELTLKNPKKAETYFVKSLPIWEKKQNQGMIGVCYRNLLKSYRDQANVKLAKEYFKKALNVFILLGIMIEIGEVKYEMARLYINIGDTVEASLLLSEAQEVFEKAQSITFLKLINIERQNLRDKIY